MKILIIFLIFVINSSCLYVNRSFLNFPYIYLLVVSPEHYSLHKKWRVCTSVCLVEDTFYLTSSKCFDNAIHNLKTKISIINDNEPKFDNLTFEEVYLKLGELNDLLVVQRAIIKVVPWNTSINQDIKDVEDDDRIEKNPFEIDGLKVPRVLLSYPDNPYYTDCYCIGYSTYLSDYDDLNKVKLKFNTSDVQRTLLMDQGRKLLVEIDDNQIGVEDYGSPIVCEIRKKNYEPFSYTAVVGIYVGGDQGLPSESTYKIYHTFYELLYSIARWSIGTNVCITHHFEDWVLWPDFSQTEYNDDDDGFFNNITRSKSILININFNLIFISIIILIKTHV